MKTPGHSQAGAPASLLPNWARQPQVLSALQQTT
jgi:hypothetical protein